MHVHILYNCDAKSQVACQLQPGVGAGLPVLASVEGSSNALAPGEPFSYNAPRVTSLDPASVSEYAGPLVFSPSQPTPFTLHTALYP